MIDRLTLTAKSVAAMAEGLRQIAQLRDPVGEITDLAYRPTGIQVGRMRVPLGVVAIIYEARPNVTADAAGLCLKAGNAAILRGGSEAIRSNQAIAACVREGLRRCRAARDRGAGDRDHRPRRGRRADHHEGLRGRHRAARRQGPDRAHLQRGAHPGAQAPGRRLPRVHRRPRRPRQGHPHRRQRQDPALRHVQHHGDAAGAPGRSPHQVLPPLARIYLDKGVELRGCARARAAGRRWRRR